jgi:hypothetical protein
VSHVRPRPAHRRTASAAGSSAVLAAAAVALFAAGCATSAPTTPGAPAPAPAGGALSASPLDRVTPSPVAAVTAGPVPPAAAAAAVRYWRLIDAHRYRPLLAVVTPDSQAAAAVHAGNAAGFWGIARVRVVSRARTLEPLPPPGATLEFSMTVSIKPARRSPWSGGRTLVFMSLRRASGSWLVYQSATGP